MSTEALQHELNDAANSSTHRVSAHLSVDTDPADIARARFFAPFIAGDETVCVSFKLPPQLECDALQASVPASLVSREWRGPSHVVLLVESGDFAAIIEQGGYRQGGVTVRAATREAAEKAVAEITNWLPMIQESLETVAIDFWQYSNYMHTTTRSIDAPEWKSVSRHYPGEVLDELDELMNAHLTAENGRVILWHGPPGTGKTSAIRAMARAWRTQAKFQVVLDPEPVFSNAASLMEVVLDDEEQADSKWRVLVVEDADEIVRADNERTSQSLSRLLNIGDGIVGQGLKILVLLTTNEPPARLHPALTRPGRCMSQVSFRRFTASEAAAAFPERAAAGELAVGDLSLAEIMSGAEAAETAAPPGMYL